MVGRFVVVLVALAACGRRGFDEQVPSDATADGTDGTAMVDAMVDTQPLACEPPPCTGTATATMCGTRCFGYCRESVLQSVARTRCNAWSGELASIHDDDEQMCMRNIVGSTGGWFGFVQTGPSPTPADGWTWLDGTPTDYYRWFTNEPGDDVDGIEDGEEQCGAIFGGGGWNDDYCTKSLAYLCAR